MLPVGVDPLNACEPLRLLTVTVALSCGVVPFLPRFDTVLRYEFLFPILSESSVNDSLAHCSKSDANFEELILETLILFIVFSVYIHQLLVNN